MERSGSDPWARSTSSSCQPALCGRYERRRVLGRGSFGTVHLCRDLYTDTFVAVKTIAGRIMRTEGPRILRELDILGRLAHSHPHIVAMLDCFATMDDDDTPDDSATAGFAQRAARQRFYAPYVGALQRLQGILVDQDNMCCSRQELQDLYAHWMHGLQSSILAMLTSAENGGAAGAGAWSVDIEVHVVMPLLHGDLRHILHTDGSGSGGNLRGVAADAALTMMLQRDVPVPFAFQLSFALDYLHKSNIVHRDLKPENVLVWVDTQTPLNSSVFLADFGLARDQTHHSDTWYVCTRFYRPPEVVLRMGTPDSSLDVWALGCILYELVTHDVLFVLPTSRDHNNRYDVMKASRQISLIVSVVGTPSSEEVQQYASRWSPRVHNHLLTMPPVAATLAARMRSKWALADTTHMEAWIDLVQSCLRFFPQQRCTAEEACRHALFSGHGIRYGENVTQFESRVYTTAVDAMTLTAHECRVCIVQKACERFQPRKDLSFEEVAERRRAHTPPLAPNSSIFLESESPNDAQVSMALGLAMVVDPNLKEALAQLPTDTDEDIAAAIDATMELLMLHTHDADLSSQLQGALRFYVTLRNLPQTEVVHGAAEDEDEGPYENDFV